MSRFALRWSRMTAVESTGRKRASGRPGDLLEGDLDWTEGRVGLNQMMAGKLRQKGRAQSSFQLTKLGKCPGTGVEARGVKCSSQVSD